MRSLNKHALITLAALSAVGHLARADVAQDWNNIALDIQAEGGAGAPATAGAQAASVPTFSTISSLATFGSAVNSNPGTRASAIQWLAVNDATVPLTNVNPAYYAHLTAPGGISNSNIAVQAAVAQASHDAIVATLPSLGFNATQVNNWTARLDNDLASSLASIGGSSSDVAAGVSLGHQAATSIVALRSNDNSSPTPTVNVPISSTPGVWSLPTNGGQTTANTPQWGNVTPFLLNSGSQFRAGPPPALTSSQYETAFKTTEAYGYHLNPTGSTKLVGANGVAGPNVDPVSTPATLLTYDPSTDPANASLHLISPTNVSATQTQAAFWRQNPSNPINQVAEEIANAKGTSLADKITLFEKLNVTLADARIAEWDTKYTYNFWRPYTAITLSTETTIAGPPTPVPGLTTGNSNLTADGNWEPYLATPNHPSYGSGHTATGAGFEFLKDYFGANPGTTFAVNSYSLDGTPYTGTTLSFSDFDEPRLDNADSRIYGGIHWTFDNTTADVLGGSVADFVNSTPVVAAPEPTGLAPLVLGAIALRRRKKGRAR